jgi:hypothetical protein
MEWKIIEERPNYSISDSGEVRNNKTGRILKPHKGTSGYYQIMLGRKTTPLYVHRLVAKAFLENPNQLPQVDHKNGIKTDNRVKNLRWVSASDNCWSFGYIGRVENRKKKIKATNGIETIYFNSRNEAAQHFNLHKSRIEYGRKFVKGKMKGWSFEIVKDIV